MISVPQTRTTSEVLHRKGRPAKDVRELAHCHLYTDITSQKTDIAIIVGLFDKESEKFPPKLLLLRFHKMQSSLSNEESTELLSIIGNVSGKGGFEMTRICGLSGSRSEQADRNILSALHDCQSSLPRRVGACKLTRQQFDYVATYRRMNESCGVSEVVSYTYGLAQRGGSFVMQPGLLEKYDLLLETNYLKMAAVVVLVSLNAQRESVEEDAIACLQVQHELSNIQSCQEYFQKSDYFSFVAHYNLLNRFSLVMHSVFYHNDYFPVKSLENKVTLVDHTRCGSGSRGGSQLGNFFSYCVLDWGHHKRSTKAWMRAHGSHHGIDPNRRVTGAVLDSLPVAGRSALFRFLSQS